MITDRWRQAGCWTNQPFAKLALCNIAPLETPLDKTLTLTNSVPGYKMQCNNSTFITLNLHHMADSKTDRQLFLLSTMQCICPKYGEIQTGVTSNYASPSNCVSPLLSFMGCKIFCIPNNRGIKGAHNLTCRYCIPNKSVSLRGEGQVILMPNMSK